MNRVWRHRFAVMSVVWCLATACGMATPTPEPTVAPNLSDLRYDAGTDGLRFVLEMVEARDHVPFYRVVEVDSAATPFPGEDSELWGAARIDLLVSDLYGYTSTVLEKLPFELEDHPLVTRIGLYPTFEDSILGFSIGLTSVCAFEVTELTDPVRIVVDVLP
jgi:hypothetical protein